jgi:hypothetical protein
MPAGRDACWALYLPRGRPFQRVSLSGATCAGRGPFGPGSVTVAAGAIAGPSAPSSNALIQILLFIATHPLPGSIAASSGKGDGGILTIG